MQPESPTPSALVFLLPLIPMLGTACTAARRLGFTDPDDALVVALTLLVSALWFWSISQPCLVKILSRAGQQFLIFARLE